MAAQIVLNERSVNQLLNSPNGGEVGRLMRVLGRRIENQAKRNVPYDTGELRSSLTHEVNSNAQGVTTTVGTNVKHSVPVHEGYRHRNGRTKVAGRPYLTDAMQSVLAQFF